MFSLWFIVHRFYCFVFGFIVVILVILVDCCFRGLNSGLCALCLSGFRVSCLGFCYWVLLLMGLHVGYFGSFVVAFIDCIYWLSLVCCYVI